MSTTTKKGGPLGVTPKSEKNDSTSTGVTKGDTLSTTPSKSTKQGVTKKTGSNNKGANDANPAILNQQALEALYSATYVEDFIDCNDNMGDDLIRQTTRMFEMGSNYMTYIRELESAMTILLGDDDGDQISPDQLSAEKKKAVFRLQHVLMTAQDTGDESLQVMQGIQDHIENKTRQLDVDRKNLAEFCKEQDSSETTFKDPPPPSTERNIKRARRVRHEIYRPSILGPSSLKATSYPETVSNNTRELETPVVTTSRSRDRDRGESQTQSSNQSAVATAASIPIPETPIATPATEEVKTNGRTSERTGGSSSRASASASATSTASATDNNNSTNEKSGGGSSSSGYTSSSSKKQSQKNQAQEKKTKKRKAKQSSSNSNSKEDNSPQQYAIDPDEPTYCLCDQVSYGEMIGCDNDLCPIEWFHFSCVSLTTKPKGKWYCPKCRGDRPNVMKPKAIFLKELEKYNREKEEKA